MSSTNLITTDKVLYTDTWDAVHVGSEVGRNGLYKRKLSDGTGVWLYDFRRKRMRYKGVIGRERDGVTLGAAKERLKAIKAEAVLGIYVNTTNNNKTTRKPFKDILTSYLEWSKAQHLDHKHNMWRANKYLLPRFGELRLEDITTHNVEQLKVELSNNGLKSDTIYKIIYLLSSIFEYARNSSPSLINPIRGKVRRLHKTARSPMRIRIYTDSEIQSLLSSASSNPNYVVAIALAVYAGLRASEVKALEWKHVDFENERLDVCQRTVNGILMDTTKSGKSRVIPMIKGSQLYDLLASHAKNNNSSGFVVETAQGKSFSKHEDFFHKIKKYAGITRKAGFHDLRHTFATNAAKKVDISTLQIWLGHSTIEMTRHYIHIDEEHSKLMMRRLTMGV